MPFVALYHTHKLVVTLFILIYLAKAIILLMGNKELLLRFNRIFKIPEMAVSTLLLITGAVMLFNISDLNLLFSIKLLIVAISIPIAVIAYKKSNKLLAIMAVVLMISAYGLAEMYKAQFGKKHEISGVVIDPASADYDLANHGKALFLSQCVVCHGADGKANLSGAKDLTISTKTDAEILELLKTGKNTMPKMADIYNEQELSALISYVTSLR